ncbi:src kinase-associated phosphoprotein 1-like [Scyliorhinus canicula]|uniref:src kinase-associated phosphoprotein 1-like n=1 Tax=Scyliorhinus canicula TaxID=7830 RepID=UPI0018F46FB2|nr:src kinase-associated phosphoprotein 1-like [Scyliorhinus canicula]XP_038635545.1 src kinase-associated phosphoprotein 1-like [Scyliorhinus canicula]XP_038635546.1 src kinase-associated phosphoprotein 1-like [Scyliorhinus canicula]
MAIPEEIRRLLEDCEYFIGEGLQGEKLSRKAKDEREVLLDGFRLVKYKYLQEFQLKGESGDSYLGSRHEDSSDDSQSLIHAPSGLSDSVSVASDNQDDGQYGDIANIAAQDLPSIMKQGYLEKKRRDHSFFGSEWQRRFCVLNTNMFYYYGNEKDKQQRGAFYFYDAYLVSNLRKDPKKNACFEVISSEKKVYQFTASSHREAKEWVDHISFVLKDMNSNFIPVEEEEEEEEVTNMGGLQEEPYDDVDAGVVDLRLHQSHPTANIGQEPDDEIYEELPEDDFPPPIPPEEESDGTLSPGNTSVDYGSFYLGLWDCICEEPDELSFKRGDLIRILSKDYNHYGWWVGEMKGIIGIVPKDYLMEAYEI